MQAIGGPEDFAAAFDVPERTIERLILYEKLLRQWQKAVNLVAPATLDAVWHRHFADSAQLLPLAPPGTRAWIDLGSGAGFPGLVVAILLAGSPSPRGLPLSAHHQPPAELSQRGEKAGVRGSHKLSAASVAAPHPNPNPLPAEERGEGIRVTLIESNARKCAFLREVARQVAVAVDILPMRAESARVSVNEGLQRVVSARALAPLGRLLGLAAPFSPLGTTLLLMKGKEVREELQMAEATWDFDVDLVPSITDRQGRVAVITNLKRKAKD